MSNLATMLDEFSDEDQAEIEAVAAEIVAANRKVLDTADLLRIIRDGVEELVEP